MAISELDDAAARIQYAFYTSDTRGMEDALAMVQQIGTPARARAMKEYYTAYGHWKLAEVMREDCGCRPVRRARASERIEAASACACERRQKLRSRSIHAWPKLTRSKQSAPACSPSGRRRLRRDCLPHTSRCARRRSSSRRIRAFMLIEAQCRRRREGSRRPTRARDVVARSKPRRRRDPGSPIGGSRSAAVAGQAATAARRYRRGA